MCSVAQKLCCPVAGMKWNVVATLVVDLAADKK